MCIKKYISILLLALYVLGTAGCRMTVESSYKSVSPMHSSVSDFSNSTNTQSISHSEITSQVQKMVRFIKLTA